MIFNKLTKLVKSNKLSQSELEIITCQFTNQQSRMFLYLAENGATNTNELRINCSSGNISMTASAINKKLIKHDVAKMVVCVEAPHTNVYGEVGQLGIWSLLDTESANEAQA